METRITVFEDGATIELRIETAKMGAETQVRVLMNDEASYVAIFS